MAQGIRTLHMNCALDISVELIFVLVDSFSEWSEIVTVSYKKTSTINKFFQLFSLWMGYQIFLCPTMLLVSWCQSVTWKLTVFLIKHLYTTCDLMGLLIKLYKQLKLFCSHGGGGSLLICLLLSYQIIPHVRLKSLLLWWTYKFVHPWLCLIPWMSFLYIYIFSTRHYKFCHASWEHCSYMKE